MELYLISLSRESVFLLTFNPQHYSFSLLVEKLIRSNDAINTVTCVSVIQFNAFADFYILL